MKAKTIIIIGCSFLFLTNCAKEEKGTKAPVPERKEEVLIIEDFEDGSLNGGKWEDQPKDGVVSILGELSSLVGHEGSKSSYYIDFDFREGQDRIGGLWLDVSPYDFSKYKYFGFWVKGEPNIGYTRVIGIGFENKKGERYTTMFGKVSDKWTRVEIPIDRIRIKDKKSISEINIVIDKRYATQKVGRIYLDDFYLR
jgi:hypothetical protein